MQRLTLVVFVALLCSGSALADEPAPDPFVAPVTAVKAVVPGGPAVVFQGTPIICLPAKWKTRPTGSSFHWFCWVTDAKRRPKLKSRILEAVTWQTWYASVGTTWWKNGFLDFLRWSGYPVGLNAESGPQSFSPVPFTADQRLAKKPVVVKPGQAAAIVGAPAGFYCRHGGSSIRCGKDWDRGVSSYFTLDAPWTRFTLAERWGDSVDVKEQGELYAP